MNNKLIKEIVQEDIDGNNSILHIFYEDGSQEHYSLPDNNNYKIVHREVKKMAQQYGAKNADELKETGLYKEMNHEQYESYLDSMEEGEAERVEGTVIPPEWTYPDSNNNTSAFNPDEQTEEDSVGNDSIFNEDGTYRIKPDENHRIIEIINPAMEKNMNYDGNNDETEIESIVIEGMNKNVAYLHAFYADGIEKEYDVVSDSDMASNEIEKLAIRYHLDVENMESEEVIRKLQDMGVYQVMNHEEFEEKYTSSNDDYDPYRLTHAVIDDIDENHKNVYFFYEDDYVTEGINLCSKEEKEKASLYFNKMFKQFQVDSLEELGDMGVLENLSHEQFKAMYPNIISGNSEQNSFDDFFDIPDNKKAKKLKRKLDRLKEKFNKMTIKEADKNAKKGMSFLDKRRYNREKRRNKNQAELDNSWNPAFTLFKKFVKWIYKGVLGLVLVATTIFGGKAIYNHFSNNTKTNDKEYTKESDRNTLNSGKTQNKKKHKTLSSALKKSEMNGSKYNAIKSVSDYLQKYNGNIAKDYSKKQKTKLAHTWNEVMASYLAGNSLNQSAINNIFDNYPFDAEKFINAFKKGVLQDTQAHIVSKASLDGDSLINKDEGKNFYINYEKLLTQCKSLTNNSEITRESVANKFYSKVKKDFLGKDAKITPAKTAVLPIIKAMNKLTDNLDFKEKLSLEEQRAVNHKVYQNVRNRFEKYEKNLRNMRMANQGFEYAYDEVSYKDLRDLTIKELKATDDYNINSEERDITKQKNYKAVIKKSVPTNIKVKKDDEKSDTKKKVTKAKVSRKLKTATIKESPEEVSKKVKDSSTDKDSFKQEKVDDSTILDDMLNNSTGDTSFDEILEGIENNTGDKVDSSSSDKVEIDDQYTDNNGNIDSSVSDITTDSSGASDSNEPLPDPNVPGSEDEASKEQTAANEVVASEIVEDMANNPTVDDTGAKTYTK